MEVAVRLGRERFVLSVDLEYHSRHWSLAAAHHDVHRRHRGNNLPIALVSDSDTGRFLVWDRLEIYLDEVGSFPNAQFDDQVDAFADALNESALGSTFTLYKV
ncbi:hypothetical protein [Mesorhizobium sp.]|uniref:hypothetical protein n=1 Tax=Mesorhizobium sp. TaxID=1871066 RepID=UPI0011FBD82F|nr:hypothetical protein [Mesorhizobium sp.]TIS66223.1 MAG: hypothetical protein E5W92_16820 [Mesorhizobium sp.]